MNTRLSVFGLGTAIGIILGLGLFLAGWLSIFGWGVHFVNVLSLSFSSLYPYFCWKYFRGSLGIHLRIYPWLSDCTIL